MTIDMEQLLSKKAEILNKGVKAKEEGNLEDLRVVNEELTKVVNEIKALKEFEDLSKGEDITMVAGVKDKNAPNGFKVLAKIMKGKVLDAGEQQLITGANATNGENNLLPEDVRLAIIEKKRLYDSALDIVGYIQTDALNGRFNLEAGGITGLVAFDDGDAIDDKSAPSFTKLEFAISFVGKIIPVSNILAGAEKASLMTYLDTWFIRNAIFSENSAIFTALKSNKTATALADWKALVKSLNKDLDRALLPETIIVTNQSGFNALDEAEDANGRPILMPDPSQPTKKLFKGYPIRVFNDTELKNIDTTHAPIFYGDTRTGVKFIEYKDMQFATSTEFLFNKNQTCLRVIEGFVVKQFDKDAYCYGSLALTKASSGGTGA